MGIYVFEKGYVLTDFGLGAAISLLMLAIVAAMSVVYVRRMLKVGEAA
jgi:ABC-type sugar transport system permease subunit